MTRKTGVRVFVAIAVCASGPAAGAQQTTPWAQEKLYQILNDRYEGRMPTVVTTNTEMSKLDARSASRLGDLHISVMYEIVAPDYRLG